jgi:hypothetical protein
MIGGQSAGGRDAVHVRVKQQLLVPGVQDGEETDVGPEMFGVARHL